MFGVGTDYCLLLVCRYREELHRYRGQARGHGARAAPRRPGGPGQRLHRVAAMLVLLLADTGSTHALGPGVGDRRRALCCSPGSRCCRRCSPPSGAEASGRGARTVAYRPRRRRSLRERGRLAALRRSRAQRPGLALGATVGAVRGSSRSACSPTRRTTRSAASSRRTSRASTASTRSARSFPQGALGPTSILVQREGGPATAGRPRRGAAAARGHRRRRVASASRSARRTGAIGKLDVTFDDDPYSDAALARVDDAARSRSTTCRAGATALVGAGSAVQ